MKFILMLLLFWLGGFSTLLAQTGQPTNYIVLLDLSDRLLQQDQSSRDIALIQKVFDAFEKKVRRKMIINSKDRFRIAIAPQLGVSYRTDTYMNDLYLDMSAEKIGDKRTKLEQMKANLPTHLKSLYADALRGKKKSGDFAGCDLWQYVNEHLPTDLDDTYSNVLVVLNDGYFDFQKNTHPLRQGNRFTDSSVHDRLRKDRNWRQTIKKPQEGLIPVAKKFPHLSVCVSEIHPKFDQLEEAELVIAIWQKWLTEMKVYRQACHQQGALAKSKSMLGDFLK